MEVAPGVIVVAIPPSKEENLQDIFLMPILGSCMWHYMLRKLGFKTASNQVASHGVREDVVKYASSVLHSPAYVNRGHKTSPIKNCWTRFAQRYLPRAKHNTHPFAVSVIGTHSMSSPSSLPNTYSFAIS